MIDCEGAARFHQALGGTAEAKAYSREAVDLVDTDPGLWRQKGRSSPTIG